MYLYQPGYTMETFGSSFSDLATTALAFNLFVVVSSYSTVRGRSVVAAGTSSSMNSSF